MSAPTNGRAVLLCGGDACFTRMLAYELTRAGYHVAAEAERADCAVADLDSGAAIPAGLPAVGYSRTGTASPGCTAVLARPFAIPALLDAIEHAAQTGEPDAPGLHCDDASRTVTFGANRLTLMPAEYALLRRLLAADGEPVSRADLIAALPSGSAPASNLAEVTICTLRRKLEESFGIRPIRTVRGVGYRYKS